MREVGRNYRARYEEKKKECDQLVAQKETAEKQLEEMKEVNTQAITEDTSSEFKQQAEAAKQVHVQIHVHYM